MKRSKRFFTYALLAIAAGGVVSCASHGYHVAGVERTRILIDSTYDRGADMEAVMFLEPYKWQVDSIMSPVVGKSARYMSAAKPESDLSNLMADILMWAGPRYGEQPVAAIYNMGGIRAALPEGTITYGDVLEIAPFENKICFLTLTGERLMQLFREIAATGGEGVSHGVELVITRDRTLKSARLGGKEIVPEGSYRIATIDYLAQGNDKMPAFKDGTALNSPQAEENDTRYIISDYFREMAAQGKAVDAKVEGRIRVE